MLSAGACIAGALAGCPTIPTGLDSPDPNERIRSILASGPADIPGLINQLDSADPAARFLARAKLVEQSGDDLGYDYRDPAWKRQEAIDRWRRWAADQGHSIGPGGVEGSGAGPPAAGEGVPGAHIGAHIGAQPGARVVGGQDR